MNAVPVIKYSFTVMQDKRKLCECHTRICISVFTGLISNIGSLWRTNCAGFFQYFQTFYFPFISNQYAWIKLRKKIYTPFTLVRVEKKLFSNILELLTICE